jgi:hypothetical protein
MSNPTEGDTPPRPYWHRPRNFNGRFERSIHTVRRDAAAAEYLADHPGTTYREIAEQFGYYDKTEARRGILRAKADVARPAIEKLIGDESRELDALYAEAMKILQRNHVTVSHGKVITWLNPETQQEEPLPDDGPRLTAISTALRIRQAYWDLHGLKQPTKTEAVVTVNPQEIELAGLIEQAEAANATREAHLKGDG